MPHDLDLVFTLTGGLTAALALGLLTHRLRLSPIVGYLLAGVIVGPFTPGFVADKPLADQLAEIGVILLMFGVGLHFHVKDLLAVRRVAVPGAVIQIAVATGLGALVARVGGWSWTSGAVFGVAISVASTVVLTRVLTDARVLHTSTGHLAIGWLVLEDLFTVLVLVLLPAFSAGGGPGSVAIALVVAVLKLAGMVAFTLLVGQRVLPRLLERVARTGSRELFTLAVLVIALGIAVGSAKLFGASMALGAFLAGMVVGQSSFSSRAASDALPLRDAFAVLFFVSVGMLLDPKQVLAHWPLAVGTLLVVLVGKPLAAIAVVLLLRRPVKTAVSVGLALAQIGEFSFIVATVARGLGLLGPEAGAVLVIAAIVSITLNPVLFARRSVIADRLASWLRRPTDEAGEGAPDEPESALHRTVVVGHGPVGRTLTRLLRDNEVEPTVIELNIDTVAALRKSGTAAVYGDASHAAILEEARVHQSSSLLVTAAGAPGESDAVIREAKAMNPGIFVLARASYLAEAEALASAGADAVIVGEAEVALAMTERLLQRLGATPEQLDRERERVRTELLPQRPE